VSSGSKLTDAQRDEVCNRWLAGETQGALAREFGVCDRTIKNLRTTRGLRSRPKKTPKKASGANIAEFSSRAKSVLWRQDTSPEKPTYHSWKARVEALESKDGGNLSHNEAIVRASKEYTCLLRLFREYDVSHFDPNPESHPKIKHFGQNISHDESQVTVEGIDQTYRDNLRWAMTAAGAFLRAGITPETCPNDASWYLYRQAIDEPKDFMGKVGQMETKVDKDAENRAGLRKDSQRSIAELNDYLAELDIEEKRGGETND